MANIKIWQISKTFPFKPGSRYSIIESDRESYLVDRDYAWWGYISPLFNWLIPEKALKIDLSKEEINTLLVEKEDLEKQEERGNIGIGWGILLGGPVGMAIFTPLIELVNENLTLYASVFIVCLTSVFILIRKVKLSKEAKRILDVIGKENLFEQRILLYPISISQRIKVLFIFHLIAILALVGNFHFLWIESNKSNIFLFVLGVASFLVYSHANGLFMLIGKYRIKILDE